MRDLKRASIHHWDVEELVCYIMEVDQDADDYDYCELEEKFYEQFDCGIDSLHEILRVLIPMVDVGKSPITEEVFKGLSVQKENDDKPYGLWMIKTVV